MDDSTIESWFYKYADDVNKFLAYLTRNVDVEDLVQETFIKALKGLSNYRKESNPKTWLLSIARSVAMNHFRKRKREPIYADSALLSSVPSPDNLLARVEFDDFYQRLLDVLESQHMKQGYREVVICRALMDMSAKDTAKVLGWTAVRVNVTYHRALKRIRELLGIQGGGLQHEFANGR